MQETPLVPTALGSTGLELTAVGFGAGPIGGDGREFGRRLWR
jgi:hypothetical protein